VFFSGVFYKEILLKSLVAGLFLCASQSAECVKFSDSEPDDINFLATKYPSKETVKPIPNSDHAFPKEVFLSTFPVLINFPVYDNPVNKQMRINEAAQWKAESSELQKAQARNKLPSVFNRFYYTQKSNPKMTAIEDIALAAHSIDNILMTQGDAPVLFLGRTPCLVQVAFEELSGIKRTERQMVHLNFSGNPDADTFRQASAYSDTVANTARNLVTPDRLAFYENYLDQKGFGNFREKLYVVDMLNTGVSLNSFLRILRHYYQSHLNQNMPEVHFIYLSLTLGSDHRHPSGIWSFHQAQKEMTFHSGFEKHGIRPLAIPTTPLQLSQYTVQHILDHGVFQELGSHGIEFPAAKWTEDYKDALNTTAEWSADIYQILRPKLKGLVLKNEVALRKIRAAELN